MEEVDPVEEADSVEEVFFKGQASEHRRIVSLVCHLKD